MVAFNYETFKNKYKYFIQSHFYGAILQQLAYLKVTYCELQTDSLDYRHQLKYKSSEKALNGRFFSNQPASQSRVGCRKYDDGVFK